MRRVLTAAVLMIGLLAASGAAPGQPTSAPAYPENPEGLRQFFSDLLQAAEAGDRAKVSAMVRSLLLPNPRAWFKEVFGEENGDKLTAEYTSVMKNVDVNLTELFMRLRQPTLLAIKVTCVEQADDPNAKGYQVIALAAMKEPAPLYTAQLSKEGTSASITLWSIAYVDGGFRLVGKMKCLKE